MEEYLLQNNSFKNRQNLTKFRISDHGLKIEIGRYQNIPREQRLCNICSEIDNEVHFFFDCRINNSIRNELLENVKSVNPEFSQNMSPFQKLKFILDPKLELLPYVCDFIKQSLELQK